MDNEEKLPKDSESSFAVNLHSCPTLSLVLVGRGTSSGRGGERREGKRVNQTDSVSESL